MREFLYKFFVLTPVYNEAGVVVDAGPYEDGLGAGAYSDWRHFAWMLLLIVLGILLRKLAKKHPEGLYRGVVLACVLMLAARTGNQIYCAIAGCGGTPWRSIPFHLCTVMSFLLPMTVIFKWRRLYDAVFPLSMMGGAITVLIGDYFSNRFLTWSAWEGMTAHSILLLAPLVMAAAGKWEIRFDNLWKAVVGMWVEIGWATLANKVFFPSFDTNYLYLIRNKLPGHIGGDKYFFFVYVLIFAVLAAAIFVPPEVLRRVKARRKLEGGR
ncbi:MAG TPA: YwaF family protein [Oscillospiraceae bacterium]|nr:YwaF family protein [Oscillospiraceae bacterium]